MTRCLRTVCLVALAAIVVATRPIAAVTLAPRTIEAYERYVAETRRQSDRSLTDPTHFLWVDADGREKDLAALRSGELVISRLETRVAGQKIEAPDGLIHHWIGLAFVPSVSVDQAVRLLQDYDAHGEVYKPNVARSKLIDRDGDVFRMSLRFYTKKVLTVVVNSEHEARFTRPAPDRAYSRIVSTRIAEVENPDTPDEQEKPVGHDGGYLWRLNSYWRFLERDGGTYLQCESITLTRNAPFGLGVIIRPFITSIPKETLTFTLERTRAALARR